METFIGDDFFKSSIESAFANGSSTSNMYNTTYINDNFNQMKDRNFALFSVQSYFKDAFKGSYYSVNQDKFIVTDQTLLDNSVVDFLNVNNGSIDIVNFAFIIDKLNSDFNLTNELLINVTNIMNKEIIENVLDGNYQSILINQVTANNMDMMDNNLIGGSGGNDTIHAGEGNDTIIGGTGDDQLHGGDGSDTYIFNVGDGHDTINDEYMGMGTNSDVVKFGTGINADDLIVTRSGDNLELMFDNSTDQITIQNWYMQGMEQKIEKFELSNGNFLQSTDIDRIIHEMSAYAVDNGIDIRSQDNIRNNEALMQIVTSGWQSV